MPLGTKSGTTPPGTGTGEKPVIFQKYFKNGNRTYASQVKLSQTGRKYLVLTEGHRDPETQELKKHTLCVFEQDLKQFFAILQETVVYLRTSKDVAPAEPSPSRPAAASDADRGVRPAKPPIAARSVSNGNGSKAAVAPSPKPMPATKAAPRGGNSRPQAAVRPAAKGGSRANGR